MELGELAGIAREGITCVCVQAIREFDYKMNRIEDRTRGCEAQIFDYGGIEGEPCGRIIEVVLKGSRHGQVTAAGLHGWWNKRSAFTPRIIS